MVKFASVGLWLLAMACGGGTPAPGGGPAGPAGPAVGSAAGSAAGNPDSAEITSCEPCLASGQNWTADRCSPGCYMDTWCYGPGNPAAPTCPAPGSEPDGDDGSAL